MKKICQRVGIMLLISIIILVIPMIINQITLNVELNSSITNDGWISFLGSYFGGILGGLATLMGVLITLRETNKQNIRPFVILDIDETPKEIYYPSYYSDLNSFEQIVNYSELPQVIDIFGMILRNTGKGYAKQVELSFSINKDDAFVTDDNLFHLSYFMQIDKIDLSGDEYLQDFKFSYIGSDGEAQYLPINRVMNGIVLSSLWNIDNNLMLSENDFLNTLSHYKRKVSNKYLTIPKIKVKLKYLDVNNNAYIDYYNIVFKTIYLQAGSYNYVKAKVEFPNNDEIKLRRKKKKKPKKVVKEKIDYRTKEMLRKKKNWIELLYDFSSNLGYDDIISGRISRDEATERYFYNAYYKNSASIENLILIIMFLIKEMSNDDCWIEKKMLGDFYNLRDNLLNNLGKVKKKKILSNEQGNNYNYIDNFHNLNKIIKSKTGLMDYYFMTYENKSNKESCIVEITDDGKFLNTVTVDIGNEKMRTEVGFFRAGYTYRINDGDDYLTIQSSVKKTTENKEFGFFDYDGYFLGDKDGWDCTYLR